MSEEEATKGGSVPSSAAPKTRAAAVRRRVVYALALCYKHWFIFGLGVAIGVAAAVPNVAKTGGSVRAEYSIKYGGAARVSERASAAALTRATAVIVIFLLTGIGLKTRVLFIQTISLVIVPSIGYGVAKGLQRTSMNASIVSGIIICLATSTTASTNVVFTKLAGGNEALAAMNAIIGNVLGIFLTPAWLVAYLRSSGSINYSAVIELLAITVIAPMVVGNVIQYKAPNKVAWLAARLDFGKVSSVCILLLVWSVFSNTFSKKTTVDAGSVVAMLFVDLFFYAATTAAALLLPLQPRIRSLLHADEEAAISAAMVAGTKTVALGIPIINACFSGNPHVGLLSLPLICYHAEQILFGSILTGPLHRWVTSVRLKAAAAKQEAAAAAMEEANGGAGGGAGGECSGESGGGEGGDDADGATRVSSHGDADGEASTSPPAEASARV